MLNSVLCTQKENANNILYTFRVKKCFCASGSIKLMHTLVTCSCNGASQVPPPSPPPHPRALILNPSPGGIKTSGRLPKLALGLLLLRANYPLNWYVCQLHVYGIVI